MIVSSSVVFNRAPLLLWTPAHPPTLSRLSNVLVPRLCAKEVVQKKDPPSFVLVTCMHDTPMILWTQHAQSYHNNGTMLVGAHANHTLQCQIHPEN